MPKPNRYNGAGKVHPNGTTMGRYVMRNGHWIDQDSPVARKAASEDRGGAFKGWLAFAMLVLVVLFAIGVQTVTEHLQAIK